MTDQREREHAVERADVELKCWPEPFAALLDGRKTFEWRREDRHLFRPGDVLSLREWDPDHERFTGRETRQTVSYVLRSRFDVPTGYVVLGFSGAALQRADAPPQDQDATRAERGKNTEPDWEHECEVCGSRPVVPATGLCGPCTFGEADTVGGNW